MFLLGFIPIADQYKIIISLFYSFLVFYVFGNYAHNYFKFEKTNFYLKIISGFIVLSLLNFALYIPLQILTFNYSFILWFERFKQIFILFIVIFSFQYWFSFKKKINFNFINILFINLLFITALILSFVLLENNLTWFNSTENINFNLDNYNFYQTYYLILNLKIDLLNVSMITFTKYFVPIIFSVLIFLSFKLLLKSEENFYNNFIVLVFSFIFIFISGVLGVWNQFYLIEGILIIFFILVKLNDNNFNKKSEFIILSLLVLFLAITSSKWGNVYFLGLGIALLFYLLLIEENIYQYFYIFMVLLGVQFFVLLYNINFIYSLLFLFFYLLIIIIPLGSVFNVDKKDDLVELETKIKINFRKILFSFWVVFIILNFIFIILYFHNYINIVFNLYYFQIFTNNEILNLIFTIYFWLFIILIPIFLTFWFWSKKKKGKKFSYLLFLNFLIIFNPFTLASFILILNLDIYFIAFAFPFIIIELICIYDLIQATLKFKNV